MRNWMRLWYKQRKITTAMESAGREQDFKYQKPPIIDTYLCMICSVA